MRFKAPRGRTLLIAFALLVAVVSAVLLVGPTQLGGPTTVLAVSGNSMEPRINSGDLVLVRAGGPYHVGQIIAYRNIPAAAHFLHRIIGTRGTGFVMKGDHNGWVDPGTARPNQVIGSLWIRIPHAGSALKWLASPLHGALLAALAAFLIGLRETYRRRRRRRNAGVTARDNAAPPVWAPHGHPPANVAPGPWARRPPPGRRALPSDRILKATLAAALIGAAACVFLAILSFSRPETVSGRPTPLFRQSGTLAYQATAPPSAVYPTGRVTSPTPVYLRLVNGATFSFAYRVAPLGGSAVSGTAQLSLVLHGNTGWSRVLAETSPQPFTGSTVRVQQWISVASIRDMLSTIESLTGSPDSYSLTVAPLVVTHGSAAGQPFVRRFNPHFTFDLTDAEMTLAGAAATPQAVTSALTSSSLVTAQPSGPQDVELGIGPLRMPVGWWRMVALVLGAAMVGLAAAAAIGLQRQLARKGEPAVISAKHRELLVPLAGAPTDGERHVTVRSFEDLVRVARRHETTILHHSGPDRSEHYLVLADGVTFGYRSTWGPETSEPPPEARTAS